MRTKVFRVLWAVVVPALLLVAACKKEQESDNAAEQKPVSETTTEPVAPSPEEPVGEPAADESADFVKVYVGHNPPKDGDPIEVAFSGFTVTSTKITDLQNLVGASAEMELDLASLSSGIAKRDDHLKSADYLDVGVSPKAAIKISDVKADGGEGKYTAKVSVSAHGASKEFTIPFTVAEATGDSVRVQGEYTFKRTDFGIGKAEGDSTADDVTLKFQLSFKKS